MTRVDLIEMIGGVLSEIDVLRGSLLPDEPKRKELDRVRKKLDQMQRQLSQSEFDETTQVYKDAAGRLTVINSELRNALAETEEIATAIGHLARFTSAVEDIVKLVLI